MTVPDLLSVAADQQGAPHDAGAHRGRAAWYDLGPATAIPLGEGRTYRVAGAEVAVFRTRAGELFAAQPWCPHRRGPLVDGTLGAASVVCPLHAFRFDLTTGAAQGGRCADLTTYPVQLGPAGTILLSLAAHAPADSPAVAGLT